MKRITRRSSPASALAAVMAAAMLVAWVGPVWAAGGVYKFVDSRGVAHFTNVPNDSRYVQILKPKKHTRPSRPPQNSGYDGLIRLTAAEHRVSPALVKAVIAAESSFNQHAVSKKGAQGLMQLMPETAAELGVQDAFSADQNVDGGARYLREMLDRYGDLSRAIAAYNAGPAAVDRYGGIPPYRETRDYVKRVLNYYRHYHGDFGQ